MSFLSFTRKITATALFLALPGLALAGDLTIKDPYVRSSSATAVTGAAFMMIMNGSDTEDRLIAAKTGAAKRVELHTHTEDANGVMKMTEIEGGIVIPAGEMHALQRGGDHVMLMGVTEALVQGEEIELTLTFEKAGDVTITVPVDHTRKAKHGQAHSATN
ncbi:MAG: copper chaperone PCu(A)C [Sulfitobacter sp.]